MADSTTSSKANDQNAELNAQSTPSDIRNIDSWIAADFSGTCAKCWDQQQEQHKDQIREAAEKVAANIQQASIDACAAID